MLGLWAGIIFCYQQILFWDACRETEHRKDWNAKFRWYMRGTILIHYFLLFFHNTDNIKKRPLNATLVMLHCSTFYSINLWPCRQQDPETHVALAFVKGITWDQQQDLSSAKVKILQPKKAEGMMAQMELLVWDFCLFVFLMSRGAKSSKLTSLFCTSLRIFSAGLFFFTLLSFSNVNSTGEISFEMGWISFPYCWNSY